MPCQLSDILILDINPRDLILDEIGTRRPLFRRNTTIPASCSREYTTTCDNQERMTIQVYESDDDCWGRKRYASYEVRGLTPKPRGKVWVRVHFVIDADGVLSVSAMEKNSGKTLVVVDRSKETQEGRESRWSGTSLFIKARTLPVEMLEAR